MTITIILAILGALMYALAAVQKVLKEKSDQFSLLYWLKDNAFNVLMTALALTVMLLMQEELKQLMGFDMTNKFGAFLGGFTAHTFSYRLTNFIKNVTPDKSKVKPKK